MMRLAKRALPASAIGAALLLSGSAFADTIDPLTFSGTTTVGGTISLAKRVTVNAGAPTTAKADVFFLTDTTGSMGGTINTVKANFGSIAGSLSGDFAFGAGEFKDQGDAFDYKLNQGITTNKASVQSAINTWGASGGGDYPEQGLYALTQAAGASTGWRDGAKKIVLIAGDAPAKTNLATVSSTAAALVAAGVTVESINVGGLGLNDYGQFNGSNSIYAAGVKGSYFQNPNSSTLVSTILDAIGSAFATYEHVTLQVIGAPGVEVLFTPSSGYTGDYDRDMDRFFDFNVTFKGLTAGVHNIQINALVDGAIVATEYDTITVLTSGVPEPSTWAMMLIGFAGLSFTAMRRRKSLEKAALAA